MGGYGRLRRRKTEESGGTARKRLERNEGKWRKIVKGTRKTGKLRDWASHTLWQSFNSFKGFRNFRGFRGFRGLKAGKRQAWTPIRSLRSHCCGLGVPVGMDRAEKKRWIWPWGSLCLRGWASQTLGQSFNGFKLRGWASHTLWQSFNSFKGFRGFRRFRGFRGFRAGKRQAWTPIRSLRSHCCGLGVPVGVDRAEKKRWIWPWGSLCLRGWTSQTLGQSFNGFKLRDWTSHTLWQSFNSFKGFRNFRGFRGLKAGKRQAWTPIRSLRSHCCGLGVPVGMGRAEKKRWIWPWGSLCLRGWASQTLGQSFNGFKLRGWASHTLWQSFNSFKGFRGFRRFRGFRGLRAGKRQAWTPIRSLRSHCCGLGVPVGVDRAEKKRWIWPWGSLCLRGWASQTLGQSFNGFKLRGWASHTLWQSFNGFKGFRRFKGFRGFRV